MDAAAQSSSPKILQFVHENGIPWTERTCATLVHYGYLAQLVYAHDHGAPWAVDTFTTGLMSLSPSIPCLDYAIMNGCPWDIEESLELAKNRGLDDVVAWINNQKKKI